MQRCSWVLRADPLIQEDMCALCTTHVHVRSTGRPERRISDPTAPSLPSMSSCSWPNTPSLKSVLPSRPITDARPISTHPPWIAYFLLSGLRDARQCSETVVRKLTTDEQRAGVQSIVLDWLVACGSTQALSSSISRRDLGIWGAMGTRCGVSSAFPDARR